MTRAERPWGRMLRRLFERVPLETVFATFYRLNFWFNAESRSGPGSTMAITRVIRGELPRLARELGVRRLLDIPCGDFHWMKEVPLELDAYIGADVVGGMVEENQRRWGDDVHRFARLDVTRDELPRVDLVLCRDCLVHLPERSVLAAIENIKRSGSTHLLTTTFPLLEENSDIPVPGLWRMINLERPPYDLPPPLELIDEGNTWKPHLYPQKSLGLWRIADL
ncbi:MAG: class I SAM-dependent methyltransferase [Myxococcota bacterium]